MSDEFARIFERERRNKGLTAADYLLYLVEETGKTLVDIVQEMLPEPYSILKVVFFSDLEHADKIDDFDFYFESFSSGDAYATLVIAQQLIRELEQVDDPDEELRPLILELSALSASGTLITMEG